jgi:hypothetical protein
MIKIDFNFMQSNSYMETMLLKLQILQQLLM